MFFFYLLFLVVIYMKKGRFAKVSFTNTFILLFQGDFTSRDKVFLLMKSVSSVIEPARWLV